MPEETAAGESIDGLSARAASKDYKGRFLLSIRFYAKSEWWVSGSTFARLFQVALKDGIMSADQGQWLDLANANGGLDVSQIAPFEAIKLVGALRSAAEREVRRLRNEAAATDGSYRISLQRLLDLPKPAAPN